MARRSFKTIDDVKNYAKERYEHGGDVIIECWEDKEIEQLIKDHPTGLKKYLDTLFSIWEEEYKAAAYFSGEGRYF